MTTDQDAPYPPARKYVIHTLPSPASAAVPPLPKLYLRLHGAHLAAVVLTPAPPVYLRGYMRYNNHVYCSKNDPPTDPRGQREREWCLVMEPNRGFLEPPGLESGLAGLGDEQRDRNVAEAARMLEVVRTTPGVSTVALVRGGGCCWFEWAVRGTGKKEEEEEEFLDWKGEDFGGWVVKREGVHGYPQLLWYKDDADVEALEATGDWVRVSLGREWIED